MLGDGKKEKAIDAFKLAVTVYPESWILFDSLGEAYAQNGEIDPAIESYEKSLKLNPGHENTKIALEQLISKQRLRQK